MTLEEWYALYKHRREMDFAHGADYAIYALTTMRADYGHERDLR